MDAVTSKTWMEEGEKVLLHTYNRYPVIFEKGEGVYLYDSEGRQYLDFAAGIGVFALGYHDAEYTEAVKNQVDALLHTSNLFYNKPAISAAKRLVKATGMDRVFFTNSGTEAIEGAIKMARRYAFNRDGVADHEIIAMNHSFHGRTTGSLAVTGNPHYQEAFKPMMPGVVFADFNDLDSVKAAVTDKTCAILLEPIQGEGGIYPATKEFLEGVRAICDEKDIILIFDEIQCGMGRSGSLYVYQQFGVKPDILTTAKALGCGVPVGAFLCTEKAAALQPGDHGTTYGGNPLVCAAVDKVMEIFETRDVTGHVKEVGSYLGEKLDELAASCGKVVEHRGMGLMHGLEMTEPVGDIINAMREQGIVIINAGANVLRFLPPLVIEKEHVDRVIDTLKKLSEA